VQLSPRDGLGKEGIGMFFAHVAQSFDLTSLCMFSVAEHQSFIYSNDLPNLTDDLAYLQREMTNTS